MLYVPHICECLTAFMTIIEVTPLITAGGISLSSLYILAFLTRTYG